MRKAFLILLLVPLAGCLSEGTDDPAPEPLVDPADVFSNSWAADALSGQNTHGDDHDHRDWTQHTNMTTPNFQFLGHDPLAIEQFGNVTAGGYFCGGATEVDGRRISVVESFDTNVAFVVVDVTDAENPEHLGEFLLDFAQTYDIDITPDGKHVVMAANVPTGQQPEPGTLDLLGRDTIQVRAAFRDTCGNVFQGPEQTVAVGPSTIMASIADLSAPSFEAWVPEPILGPHSISTAEIDGTTYVVSSITNLAQHLSYFHVFSVQDTPAGSTLLHVALLDSGLYGDVTSAVNGHIDAEIAMHPSGTPVMYLSNWGGGMAILDFSIPQLPLPLGSWKDDLPQGGAIHSTFSIDGWKNDRHYVLAGQEFIGHPTNRPSGWVYILDDTDPNNIIEVGRWTLPVDTQLDWLGTELFSTHYFRVVNETAFVAMYHGGVWAFELDFEEPANMALPRSLGVFMPHLGPQNGRDPTGGYDYAPFVLDAFAYDDYQLVVYDNLSGVYSVRFDPDMDVESPAPWPREGIPV